MDNSEDRAIVAQRTRRNIVKMGTMMGAIAASAVLANLAATKRAAAQVAPTAVGRHCFLKGTRIRTAEGERKVENLAIGDLLPTVFGGVRPIQWLGYYPYKKSDPSRPWVKDALPVRIARSALASNVPDADLYVTKWHALFIDGALVPVENLINDTTITLYEAREYEELEYFHIKLESHDVIYAEGAPCETLLHVDEGAVNFAEYFRRYGAPEKEEVSCVPRYNSGRRWELKSRFRSAVSPWLDFRQKIDVIRDRVEERGIALSRQSALTS